MRRINDRSRSNIVSRSADRPQTPRHPKLATAAADHAGGRETGMTAEQIDKEAVAIIEKLRPRGIGLSDDNTEAANADETPQAVGGKCVTSEYVKNNV